jgi:glutamyl-tRNA reductase
MRNHAQISRRHRHRILRKILHRPTVRARQFSTDPKGPVYLEALRQLFDLSADEART